MLDPQDAPTEAPSTNATDASQSPIHNAWNKWTSDPANNAALLQFGIAMLQPRAPGQSGVGQFANAIGQGGEASGRVTAAQNAEDLAASTEEDRKAATAAKTSNAASTAATAAAYGRSVDNAIANPRVGGTSAVLKSQADFNRWLSKPEDLTGLTSDPIVGAISKAFPDIKSKADLLNNPAALAAARRLYSAQVAEPTGEDPAAAAAPVTPPAPTFVPRQAGDKNGKVWSESSPGVWQDSQGNTYKP